MECIFISEVLYPDTNVQAWKYLLLWKNVIVFFGKHFITIATSIIIIISMYICMYNKTESWFNWLSQLDFTYMIIQGQ